MRSAAGRPVLIDWPRSPAEQPSASCGKHRDDERPVQTVLGAERVELLGGDVVGVGPGHRPARVAGQGVEHDERHRVGGPEHADRLGQASREIASHGGSPPSSGADGDRTRGGRRPRSGCTRGPRRAVAARGRRPSEGRGDERRDVVQDLLVLLVAELVGQLETQARRPLPRRRPPRAARGSARWCLLIGREERPALALRGEGPGPSAAPLLEGSVAPARRGVGAVGRHDDAPERDSRRSPSPEPRTVRGEVRELGRDEVVGLLARHDVPGQQVEAVARGPLGRTGASRPRTRGGRRVPGCAAGAGGAARSRASARPCPRRRCSRPTGSPRAARCARARSRGTPSPRRRPGRR